LPFLETSLNGTKSTHQIPERLLHVFRRVRYHAPDARSSLDDPAYDVRCANREPGPTDRFCDIYRQEKISTAKLQPWFPKHELVCLYRWQKPVFNEIKSLLGPHGLQIIDDIRIHSSQDGNRFYTIWFKPSRTGGSEVELEQLSHGVRRVVETVISIVSNPDSILLWDHPEGGMDLQLLRKMISLMRTYSEGGQLILATHSPTVLNSLESEEVQLVRLERGETVVRPLSLDEAQSAREYVHETGTLAEFIEMLQEA
jgi:hypothetical protein